MIIRNLTDGRGASPTLRHYTWNIAQKIFYYWEEWEVDFELNPTNQNMIGMEMIYE